jgi:putative addiction module killer protein
MRVVVYEDEEGCRPFDEWFDALPAEYAAKVLPALARIEAGLTSGLKSVGEGVQEWRIDGVLDYAFMLPLMASASFCCLVEGSKRRQQADITAAKRRWADYQKRRTTRRK